MKKNLMTVVFTIILAIFFTSCNKVEMTKRKLEKTIKKCYEDKAFKDNLKIKLLEVKVIKYKPISLKGIDSLIMIDNYLMFSNMVAQIDELKKDMIEKQRSYKFFYSVDANDKILNNSYEDYQTARSVYLEKTKSALSFIKDVDSTYISKDSLTFAGYEVKYFLKSTIGEINILDTMLTCTDNEFIPKKLEDIRSKYLKNK